MAKATSTPPLRNPQNRRGYWVANLRLITVLLVIWAVVSYGLGIVAAAPFDRLHAEHGVGIGQLPIGFWFAQQGAIYTFVVLIFVYAWQMDRLDRKYGVGE